MFAVLKRWWYRRKLASAYPAVRCAGVRGLAGLGGQEVLPDLVGVLLDDSADVSRAATDALDSIDPSWVSTAIDGKTLRRIVQMAISDASSATLAADLLGRARHPETVAALLQLPAPAGQAKVIEAALDRASATWTQSEEASRALRAFLAAPTENCPFWVARVVQDSSDVQVALLGGQLAWQRGDSVLWRAVRHAAIHGRGSPLDWLGVLNNPARPVHLRELAAEALACHGLDAATTALLNGLASEDRFLRYAAVRALGRGGCQRAVPAMVSALEVLLQKRQDPIGRETLAWALGESRDVGAAAVLLLLVDKDDWNPARIAAVKALRRLMGDDFEPLLALLARPHATPLYPYCHDLIAAQTKRYSQRVCSDARMAHDGWKADQRTGVNHTSLLYDLRDVFHRGSEINVVARMASVRQRLIDARTDIEDFLEHVRWKLGLNEARDLADAWGIGGVWRHR